MNSDPSIDHVLEKAGLIILPSNQEEENRKELDLALKSLG
jgi:hypothetical protein